MDKFHSIFGRTLVDTKFKDRMILLIWHDMHHASLDGETDHSPHKVIPVHVHMHVPPVLPARLCNRSATESSYRVMETQGSHLLLWSSQ